MIEGLTEALIYTAWTAALIFLGRFAITTWRQRTAGILTIAFVVSIFGVLSLAATTAIFGTDYSARSIVRFCVYLGVNFLLWSGVTLLIKDQRRARRSRRRKNG